MDTGLVPVIARGSGTPTFVRATSAFTDVIDTSTDIRTLTLVSSNVARVARRKEQTGGTYVTGYLAELASTNLILQSQTFGTTWTQSRVTVSSDALAAPDGTMTMDGLVADSANNSHQISQNATLTAATYTTSVFAKKGNRDWLVIFENTLGNGIAFNLATGAVGNRFAASANVTGAIEAFGNGIYRCSITFTGTAALRSQQFFPSTGDLSANGSNAALVFIGDGATVSTYVWGAQVELGAFPTSYIATTGSTATRNKDELSYVVTGNVPAAAPITVIVNTLAPNRDTTGITSRYVDIGTSTDNIRLKANGNVPSTQGTVSSSAQWDIDGTTDITDGNAHAFRLTMTTNSAKLLVDLVQEGSTDSSCTFPSNAGSIFIGQSLSGAEQPSGLISRVRIYSGEVTS